MHKSPSLPRAGALMAALVLLTCGLVSLQAENAFVTSYTGSTYTADPPFAYGTGISAFGTSSVGTATPAPPSRSRAMYGWQLGTNAWVTTQPALGYSGPGVSYKIYVLRGTDGNASGDVIVNVTTDNGTLLNTSGAPQATLATTAFRNGSGAVNNWLWVGTLTNLTSTTPKLLWAYASGNQAATGGRCYFDAFRFFYDDPCAVVTETTISGGVYSNQTVVNVSGVVAGATDITVYANDAPIGSTNYPAGFAAGTVPVPTSALVPGTVLKSQQFKSPCTSQMPLSGPIVGGGPNPQIRLSLGCWQNASWTGPIGANAASGFTNSYFVKATGLVNNYGTAPVGGQQLPPGACWQTVTFNQQVDPCINQSSALSMVNNQNFCALESLTFARDAADSGPYEIYVDRIMNGTNVVEDFESYTEGTEATFNNPNAASVPTAGSYYNSAAPNDSLVSQAHAYDGTKSCRIRWQWSDGADIRWAHVLANGSSGKTYPMLDVRQPVTVRVLVLPVGATVDHKFTATVSAITNSTPLYQGGTVELGVTVSPPGAYTYEWFYQGNSLGITTPSYTNYSLPFSPTDGPYSVKVSDGTCSESPAAVNLTLATPVPIITNPPVSVVVNAGSPAAICVGATNAPAGGDAIQYYTWEKIEPGVSTNFFNSGGSVCLSDYLPNAQPTDTAYYRVIVQGSYGSVTSTIVSLQVVDAGVVIGNGTGLRGDYFNLPTFTGEFSAPSWAGTPALTRVDPTVNYEWGQAAPAPGVNADYFAVRWYGQIQPLYSDTYTFTIRSDDGARLWIDQQLVIDYWHPQGATDRTGTATLNTTKHDILIEYFDRSSFASAIFYWTNNGGNLSKSVVPVQQLFANKASWTPPATTLTAPANGSSVQLPAAVVMSANVTTNDGIVKQVNFYTNGVLLASATAPPFSYTWNNAAVGTYAISARTVYNESSLAVSATNTVTVLANAAAPVTISNITATAITYGGGAGAQFVLLRTNSLAGNPVPHAGWLPVATNYATPGSFPISAGAGSAFYYIESR